MSKRRILATAIVVASGLGVVAANAAGASGAQPSFAVGQALVNKTGGITVRGTVDCSDAANALFDGAPPADTLVLVNVSWDAYQAAGRKTMLHATYSDGMASPCWTNISDPQSVGCASGGAPCSWDSVTAGSSGWVYGNGKFRANAVHVDAVLTGTYVCGPNQPNDCYQVDDPTSPLTNLGMIASADLRAVKG